MTDDFLDEHDYLISPSPMDSESGQDRDMHGSIKAILGYF